MIRPEDVIITKTMMTKEELNLCNKISSNTVNTWQSNRSSFSKVSDTIMGKTCEKALLSFMDSNAFLILDYDTIREDNFKNHAPLDFLIIRNKKHKNELINFLKEKSKSNTSYSLSKKERDFINNKEGLTCELKSTRLTGRHKVNDIVSLDKIIKDDFLFYPRYIRKSNNINNLEDYLQYCQNNYKIVNKEQLIENEKESMEDVYFRAYLDDKENQVFLIGGISKEKLVEGIGVKKMIQKNKSESSIYFYKKLSQGSPLNHIKRNMRNFKKNGYRP